LCGCWLRSAAAEGLHDGDFIVVVEWCGEITCDVNVDEDPHVLPEPALFVDDSEPETRELRVEIAEHVGDGVTHRGDDGLLGRVGPQRGRDADAHRLGCSAARALAVGVFDGEDLWEV
jgi:anaerobic selenocysteine-containing dehydrogenase